MLSSSILSSPSLHQARRCQASSHQLGLSKRLNHYRPKGTSLKSVPASSCDRSVGQDRNLRSARDNAKASVNGFLAPWWKDLRQGMLQATAAASLALCIAVTPAFADGAPPIDAAQVGTCLLGNCQLELAGCIGDVECLKNLVCLQSCNDADDVTACQLRCGDLHEDQAVTTFNSCALSRKKCVAQRVDTNLYPVPPDSALDTNFDLNAFTGRWYISAGLNPLFDTFDCQVHFFDVPEPGKLEGKINWRISKGKNDFLERSTKQTFIQQANPALLLNHGNEYLHYEDDWYILASKPDEYVLIYYKGNNDAWKGYGGATVYTRTPVLSEQYVPELKRAAEAAGIDWSQMKRTDNTCEPRQGDLIKSDFEDGLKSFGKGFTVVERDLLKDLSPEDRDLAGTISDAEELLKTLGTKAKAVARDIADEVKEEGRALGEGLESIEASVGKAVQGITQPDTQKDSPEGIAVKPGKS